MGERSDLSVERSAAIGMESTNDRNERCAYNGGVCGITELCANGRWYFLSNLKIYSDSACTVECIRFTAGQTIYINGDVCYKNAEPSGTAPYGGIYTQAGVLKSGFGYGHYSYPANTVRSIKTIYSNVAPSFDSTGWTDGYYYIQVNYADSLGNILAIDRETFEIYTPDVPINSFRFDGDDF